MENKWRMLDGAERVTLPCWATDGVTVARFASLDFSWPPGKNWTHWMPAEKTPEPPREPSQAEMDERSYWSWREGFNGSAGLSDAWNSALAYERAEIAKMLPNCPRDYELTRVESAIAAIAAIRARCNGGVK